MEYKIARKNESKDFGTVRIIQRLPIQTPISQSEAGNTKYSLCEGGVLSNRLTAKRVRDDLTGSKDGGGRDSLFTTHMYATRKGGKGPMFG